MRSFHKKPGGRPIVSAVLMIAAGLSVAAFRAEAKPLIIKDNEPRAVCCVCTTDECFGGKADDPQSYCHRLLKSDTGGWAGCDVSIVTTADASTESIRDELQSLPNASAGMCSKGINVVQVGHGSPGTCNQRVKPIVLCLAEVCTDSGASPPKSVFMKAMGCNTAKDEAGIDAMLQELGQQLGPGASITVAGTQCYAEGNPDARREYCTKTATINKGSCCAIQTSYSPCYKPGTKRCDLAFGYNQGASVSCTDENDHNKVKKQYCCPRSPEAKDGGSTPIYEWTQPVDEDASHPCQEVGTFPPIPNVDILFHPLLGGP